MRSYAGSPSLSCPGSYKFGLSKTAIERVASFTHSSHRLKSWEKLIYAPSAHTERMDQKTSRSRACTPDALPRIRAFF
jgi:hypothetical protein